MHFALAMCFATLVLVEKGTEGSKIDVLCEGH